jgi:hypothetical protein
MRKSKTKPHPYDKYGWLDWVLLIAIAILIYSKSKNS